MSNWVTQKFDLNKATGKKITLANEASKNYPGNGAFTLVDGVQNEKGFARSSEFLGFLGKDLDATIDLGNVEAIVEIRIHTLTQTGSWIYPPGPLIKVMTSSDGINFSLPPGELIMVEGTGTITKIWFSQLRDKLNARYLKVYIPNYGIIPSGKPGAGNPAWLFVDEIEVE